MYIYIYIYIIVDYTLLYLDYTMLSYMFVVALPLLLTAKNPNKQLELRSLSQLSAPYNLLAQRVHIFCQIV